MPKHTREVTLRCQVASNSKFSGLISIVCVNQQHKAIHCNTKPLVREPKGNHIAVRIVNTDGAVTHSKKETERIPGKEKETR